MPDVFDANGLQVKTRQEIVTELQNAFYTIFGADINLDPNSPDGQLIATLAQQGVDLRELLSLINAGFDPDQAEGVTLDQRVGINGIARGGGTFTEVSVNVQVDRALSLVGLDTQSNELTPSISNLYTVRDNAGNQFYLLDSQTPASAGTYSYSFRAAEIGAVSVTASTITSPVTVVPGVISVNNPSGPSVVGVDEESDAALRVRRAISQSISSQGNINGLQAALANLSGVSTAIVRENNTAVTDGDGIPGHSIWAIVEGGDDTEIAQTIKSYKTAGAGMKGTEEVDLPYNDGRAYIIKFDRPTNQDLYIQFSLSLPGGIIDDDSIKALIVENIIWKVGADARASVITAYVQGLNPNYVITGMEISDDDTTYAETVSPTDSQHRFINDVTRITIT